MHFLRPGSIVYFTCTYAEFTANEKNILLLVIRTQPRFQGSSPTRPPWRERGSFNIDDGNGSENLSFKMNFRFFNLCRVLSNLLNKASVGEFPWS